MRIGQLAEAAGTTTRTVRHYHRLGLLPEPRRLANGYREYAMGDLLRLLRIRWLAAAGMPLGSIAAVLAEERTSIDERDVVADLRALLGEVEREQTVLARRHTRLTGMLCDAERGRAISALPGELARALDGAVESAPSLAVGEALRRERDLLEAMVSTGAAPEQFVTGFSTLLADPDALGDYLALLAEWTELEGREPVSVADRIDLLARRMLAAHERSGMELGIPDVGSAESGLPSLTDIVPDPAQREVVRRFLEHSTARGVEQGR